MANLAYQVTQFAYQGSGQFAYQEVSGGVAPAVAPTGAGRRRRQPIIYRLFFKGKPYLFDDIESLIAFLTREELAAEERVEKVAQRDAERITRVGRTASPPRPPLVRMRSEVPEIKDYITSLQQKLDALYWRKLEGQLVEELDEEEDLSILAAILRL